MLQSAVASRPDVGYSALVKHAKDLQERARVNEVMDWVNVNFYRDFGYGLVYPQLFPHHKRRSDEAHAGAIEWGRENARIWLKVLNDHWIGPNRAYLCGDKLTIADYFAAPVVTIGEYIGCDSPPTQMRSGGSTT